MAKTYPTRPIAQYNYILYGDKGTYLTRGKAL